MTKKEVQVRRDERADFVYTIAWRLENLSLDLKYELTVNKMYTPGERRVLSIAEKLVLRSAHGVRAIALRLARADGPQL